MSLIGRTTRAFTLIEVLLALALLAGIAGGALGLFENLTRRQEQIRAHSERAQGGGLVMERLESSLATSFAQGADGSVGLNGDSTSIHVHHHGVIGHAAGDSGDLRSLDLDWSEADGTISAGFHGAGAESATETLAEGVERVRFRYFHGARWRTSFDAVQAGGLPSAIEIAIWFAPAIDNAAQEVPSPFPDGESEFVFDEELPLDVFEGEPELPTRRPDRLRVMVIPDAPDASWEVGG